MGKKKKIPGCYSFWGRRFNIEVNRGQLTSLGPTVRLKVKDSQNTYDLLPQGKIFICFSRNTSEIVHRVQNELLLENLNPHQSVEWIPMVWEVLTPLNAYGTDYSAQEIINTYIDKADHIVFIVKDSVGDGLKSEWDKYGRMSKDKTIHLCIYANENEMKVHKTLDPMGKNIHFPYSDFKDIIMYLKSRIHPKAELTGNEQKLHFVQTKEQLYQLRDNLRKQTSAFKREKVDPRIILGMERLIESIDKKGPEILIRNVSANILQPAIIKVNPLDVTKLPLTRVCVIPSKEGKKGHKVSGFKHVPKNHKR